jgi:hypothetical protein
LSVTLPSLSIPCPTGNTHCLDHRHLFDSSGSGAMLINGQCDIVPPHAQHCPPVLQHVYKRLSPHNIVHLTPGDEIIVVLPAETLRLSRMSLSVNSLNLSWFGRGRKPFFFDFYVGISMKKGLNFS